MATLAAELAGRAVPVTLLTARWQPTWPAEIRYRGVPVVRLPHPQVRIWGTLRYMQALARWLRRHRDEYDLVYVSMLKHDAYAALAAVGEDMPVVLRAEGAGPTGDCRWQQEARCGRRIRKRCTRADAVVVPSRAMEQELLNSQYPGERIHFVPNGIAIPPVRSVATQLAARNALAATSFTLRLPQDAPLAVFTGRLHPAKGLGDLMAAWEPVATRWPDARLWLVGEGPFQEELEAEIEARSLKNHVVLAGVFDNVDQLLAAADLFVLPSWEEGMSLALLEAMAAGLPVVACDIPGNRDLVADGQTALLVPVRDPPRLSQAIERLLNAPLLRVRLGEAAREVAINRFSLPQMADLHLELFDRVVAFHREAKCR